jgi:branched-chain amino acid transport system substrate-binding protein
MRFAAALVLAIAFVSIPAPAASPREIVVGQVVDYTGEQGEATRDYVAGAKVFFDAFNARGGLHGAKIRLVVLDGGKDAASVRARTRQLIDEQRADVLFGYVGDAAVAAAASEPELREGGMALVGPLAGGDAASQAVFYTRPDRNAEIEEVMAHFRALQVSRFARLAPADLANVAAVKARNAQALIIDADTALVAEFVRRYRPLDPGILIVGLSTVNHQALFQLLGPQLVHGVMITQVVPNPMLAESALLKEHLDAIRTFRDEPPSHLTLEGFVAAKALVEGLRRAGPAASRADIAKALRAMGRVDLGGFAIDLRRAARNQGAHVDLAMIRRDGSLLR